MYESGKIKFFDDEPVKASFTVITDEEFNNFKRLEELSNSLINMTKEVVDDNEKLRRERKVLNQQLDAFQSQIIELKFKIRTDIENKQLRAKLETFRKGAEQDSLLIDGLQNSLNKALSDKEELKQELSKIRVYW